MQTQVKVLGGIEITVEFNPADLEETKFKITHITGTPIRPNYYPQWLYDRIIKADEEDKVIEACYDAIHDSKYIQ